MKREKELLKTTLFVTKDGKVYNQNTGRELKQQKWNGYRRINTIYKGKRCTVQVHRLVAVQYIKNPNNYDQVNHKNSIKSDNTVNNLEWCTAKQNIHHAVKAGRINFSLFGKMNTAPKSDEHKKNLTLALKAYYKKKKQLTNG